MKLSELDIEQASKKSCETAEIYRALDEDNSTTSVLNEEAFSLAAKQKCRWNWDNSLRSNCDDFLETLEYDINPERYLKRKNLIPMYIALQKIYNILVMYFHRQMPRMARGRFR